MEDYLNTDRNALFSLRDKGPYEAFAAGLRDLGWNIFGSSGTAKRFNEIGIRTTSFNDFVSEPILDHLVVTLHPKIHAGLVAKDTEAHRMQLRGKGYPWFGVAVVNLYPLESAIAAPNATVQTVSEEMDLGGVALLRSASKGAWGHRLSLYDPADIPEALKRFRCDEPLDLAYCHDIAAKTDVHVARYCSLSGIFRGNGKYRALFGRRVATCLYGENRWQTPAEVFTTDGSDPLAIDQFTLLEGEQPSFTNRTDYTRALQTLRHMATGMGVNGLRTKFPYFALAVKHGNPCGAAYGDNPTEVLKNVVLGNPLAIFGGVVIPNFPIRSAEAEVLAHFNLASGVKRRNLDSVLAPEVDADAFDLLGRKNGKCRFLANPALTSVDLDHSLLWRPIGGGFLTQPNYTYVPNFANGTITEYGTERSDLIPDLVFGKAICDTSNSNTITLVKNRMLIGNGVGQQSRVRAAKLAIEIAREDGGHDTAGSVAVSDSFFPEPDGPTVLCDAGVSAIFTTSGSVKDQATIDVCANRGIALYMIPDAVGRGFAWHG